MYAKNCLLLENKDRKKAEKWRKENEENKGSNLKFDSGDFFCSASNTHESPYFLVLRRIHGVEEEAENSFYLLLEVLRGGPGGIAFIERYS